MVREGGQEDYLLQLLKSGHMVMECPETKSKPSTLKKTYKKKALKATWDSEIESEEEVDTTHACFRLMITYPK